MPRRDWWGKGRQVSRRAFEPSNKRMPPDSSGDETQTGSIARACFIGVPRLSRGYSVPTSPLPCIRRSVRSEFSTEFAFAVREFTATPVASLEDHENVREGRDDSASHQLLAKIRGCHAKILRQAIETRPRRPRGRPRGDGSKDVLTGGDDQDWFLADALAKVLDVAAGETLTTV